MTSKLSVLLKKYSIPTLFFIVAIIMIYVGISQNQDATYMVASMLMLAAGIVSLMYSSGKFKQSVVLITGSIAGIAAVFSLYMSYKSVNDTNTYNKNYVLCKATAVQNLQDIRYIQKAYADKNGKYAAKLFELFGKERVEKEATKSEFYFGETLEESLHDVLLIHVWVIVGIPIVSRNPLFGNQGWGYALQFFNRLK